MEGKQNNAGWIILIIACAAAFLLFYPWDQAGARAVPDLPLLEVLDRNADKAEAAHHGGIIAASMEEFGYLMQADAHSETPKYDTAWKLHELRVKTTSAFMSQINTKEKYPDNPPPGLAATLQKFLDKRLKRDVGKLRPESRQAWLQAAHDIASAARYAQKKLGG